MAAQGGKMIAQVPDFRRDHSEAIRERFFHEPVSKGTVRSLETKHPCQGQPRLLDSHCYRSAVKARHRNHQRHGGARCDAFGDVSVHLV